MTTVSHRLTLILTLSVATVTGCAHTVTNQILDAKIAQEPPLGSREDLNQETKKLIESDSLLTPEQRQKLLDLERETATRIEAIWQKNAKLRAVLIKDLINTDYNEGEVEIIKDKMRALEDQRLDTIFSAVKKANMILNKEVASHSKLMNGFFNRSTK